VALKIDTSSRAYEILWNGCMERQLMGDHFEHIMRIMCEDREADMLLDLANSLYPGVAPDIARDIDFANQP
jgi:hypothetical protein